MWLFTNSPAILINRSEKDRVDAAQKEIIIPGIQKNRGLLPKVMLIQAVL